MESVQRGGRVFAALFVLLALFQHIVGIDPMFSIQMCLCFALISIAWKPRDTK